MQTTALGQAAQGGEMVWLAWFIAMLQCKRVDGEV